MVIGKIFMVTRTLDFYGHGKSSFIEKPFRILKTLSEVGLRAYMHEGLTILGRDNNFSRQSIEFMTLLPTQHDFVTHED